MQKQIVQLFSRVRLPEKLHEGEPAGPRLVAILNLECATFGYAVGTDLGRVLAALSAPDFTRARLELLDLLAEVSGAGARHATLFARFPHEGPDGLEFLANWILASVGRLTDLSPAFLHINDRGDAIDIAFLGDPDVRDPGGLESDGWHERVRYASNRDPESRSVDGLLDHDEVRDEFVRRVPLKILHSADRAFLRNAAAAMVARPSSLSADEKAFLRAAVAEFGFAELMAPLLEAGRKPFRETLPFLYELSPDIDSFAALLSGATDVLRAAVFVSAPEGDLSLAVPAKLKLKHRHKRDFLTLLEGRPNLVEDLLRHRSRWLAFGEHVNPGSAKNRGRYPRVAAAFDTLRNHPKTVLTFNRTVEGRMRSGKIDGDLLRTLSSRPGEFLRRLDALLRTAGPDSLAMALDAFAVVVGQMSAPALFMLDKHLRHRLDAKGQPRIFFPKGNANRIQIVEDRRKPLPPEAVIAVSSTIAAELRARFSLLPPMGRVWLDPALAEIVVPFNIRGDSASSVPMPKGSRLPLEEAGEVVRLFVHWTGGDVDLSVLMLDDALDTCGHVSFTNLDEFGCIHSGDVRHAPLGASEFIDFEPARLRESGVRYVVGSVISSWAVPSTPFPASQVSWRAMR